MSAERKKASSGKSVIAVEIGQDWFKFVELDVRRERPSLSRVMLKPTDEMGGLTGEALVRGLRALNIHGVPVVVCLSRQMVNIRLFDLPSGDPREIADMIDLQISRQTPYSRDEIVFDYCLADSERDGYTRVMLAIAQVAAVQQRFRVAEEAGWTVAAMTVTTEGWVQSLASLDNASARSDGASLHLDLDSSTGDAMVFRRGVPLFSRSIAVGAQDFVADRARAESRLVQEMSRAIEAFRSEMAEVRIERMAVSGAMAWVPAIAARLQDEFHIPVEERNVAVLLSAGASEKYSDDARLGGVSLTGVIGSAIAMRDLQINLTPESVKTRRAIVAKARDWSVFAILTIAICALLTLWVESRLSRRRAYLDEIKGAIARTTRDAEAIDAMRRKIGIVAGRMDDALLPARVLAELHARLGPEVTLSSLEIDRKTRRVVCRGTVDSVSKLVSALAASPPIFQNVKTTSTAKVKDAMEFEVTFEVGSK